MGLRSSKIAVIPNGVNTNFFKPFSPNQKNSIKQEMGLADSNVILFVGNFAPLKGLHVLINSIPTVLRQNSNTVLLIAGANSHLESYNQTLLSQIQKQKIDRNIRFLGYVGHDRLVGLYNIADIFVSASFVEGCALNILEAASCGTPVIASDVGGASDVLGEHGIFFFAWQL